MTISHFIELGAIVISVISLIYTLKTRKKLNELEEEKIEFTRKIEKENTLQTLKKEIQEYRITLNNIYKDNKIINHVEKDIYTFNSILLDSKLKNLITEKLYSEFMSLNVDIDETIDIIIYKKDYTRVSYCIRKITRFLSNLDEIKI